MNQNNASNSGGKEAGGLAIPGALFTTLGLLFTYQNLFNRGIFAAD